MNVMTGHVKREGAVFAYSNHDCGLDEIPTGLFLHFHPIPLGTCKYPDTIPLGPGFRA